MKFKPLLFTLLFSCTIFAAVIPGDTAAVTPRDTVTNLTRANQAVLETCIDYCDQPGLTGICVRNYCDASFCTNIGPGNGDRIPVNMDSIGFKGHTSCTLYRKSECQSVDKYDWIRIDSTALDLGHYFWGYTKVKSFRCSRPD
jgi:hypothetical protein